jgi:hypothetical protein
MLDVLRDFSESKPVTDCRECGKPRGLYRLFDFGLAAGQADCKVLHAFLPRELEWWPQGEERVTFYPYLIAMEYTDGRGKTFWLPYWHTVTRERSGTGEMKRYGQWTPFLAEDLFKSLLAQAREKGYLLE